MSEFIEQKNRRALVVDDDGTCRLIVSRALKNAGLDVDQAENGFEALGRCQMKVYDLILMDIEMAELDGYEVTQAIRQLENANKSSYIMALTGRANSITEVMRCNEMGMDNVMIKPFSMGMFKDKLIEWVAKCNQVA